MQMTSAIYILAYVHIFVNILIHNNNNHFFSIQTAALKLSFTTLSKGYSHELACRRKVGEKKAYVYIGYVYV